MKRWLAIASLFVSLLASGGAGAELVCADAGATGVLPVQAKLGPVTGGGVVVEPVCVLVP